MNQIEILLLETGLAYAFLYGIAWICQRKGWELFEKKKAKLLFGEASKIIEWWKI